MSDYQNLINLLNYKVLDHLENMIYPLMAMFDKFYQRQVQRQKLQILFAKKLKRKELKGKLNLEKLKKILFVFFKI